MFVQNDAYGHKLILQRYCGAQEKLPIWGEIQHSFWSTEPKWKANRDPYFSKNFTWNNLLSLPRQIPIGDPWFYLNLDTQPQFSSSTLRESIIVNEEITMLVPQQTGRQESIQGKLERHKGLLEFARKAFHNNKILVFLHHLEESKAEFRDIYRHHGEQVTLVERIGLDAIESAQLTSYFLNTANVFFTNYGGAHLVRRYLIDHRNTFLINKTGFFQEASGVVLSLLNELDGSVGKDRVEISKILLGWEFKQSPKDLAQTLGFVGLRSLLGPVIKKFHNKRIYR